METERRQDNCPRRGQQAQHWQQQQGSVSNKAGDEDRHLRLDSDGLWHMYTHAVTCTPPHMHTHMSNRFSSALQPYHIQNSTSLGIPARSLTKWPTGRNSSKSFSSSRLQIESVCLLLCPGSTIVHQDLGKDVPLGDGVTFSH
jgi:hypothetical protein